MTKKPKRKLPGNFSIIGRMQTKILPKESHFVWKQSGKNILPEGSIEDLDRIIKSLEEIKNERLKKGNR